MRTILSGRRARKMNPAPGGAGKALAVRTYFGGGGAVVFTAPTAGKYRFYLWGGAGSAISIDYRPDGLVQGPSGGTGSLAVIERRMAQGETASLAPGAAGAASTVTFSDGYVVTAGAGGNGFNGGATNTGTGGLGGVATGGDININGQKGGGFDSAPTAGGGTDGGAPGVNYNVGSAFYWGGSGAPGVDNFRGGNGGTPTGATAVSPTSPGGGGVLGAPPASGHITVVQRS